MSLQKRRIVTSIVAVGLVGILAGCSTYGHPGYFGNGYRHYGAYGVGSGHSDRGHAYSQPHNNYAGVGRGHGSAGGHNRGGHGGGGRRH